MVYGKAEDAGGLSPVKDDNAAIRYFIRRTLTIFNCGDYIYGVEVSDSTVSRITDKILPIAKEWQQRPLEEIYAVVFLDAIHYHVRSEGQIVKKAVYIAIGIDLDGKKDVLGMWVGENESAKF